MIRLGLTGGIGSGKSTVAALMAKCGAAVIDADAISRQLTAPGGLAIAAITQQFGPIFITPDGALDRDRMRALAYADPGARKQLESIIHPLVGLQVQTQAAEAQNSGRRCAVFDIPLLVESAHWRQKVERVLVVDCSSEVQCQRVMARSQLTRAEVEAIVASQATRERRLAAADVVIFNEKLSLTQLAIEVKRLAPVFGLSSG